MKKPIATYALLAINALVFFALAVELQSLTMDTSGDVMTILHWGSNVNPLTLGGEPWRIITSMFLHFGIWHLAVNMYALYSMGRGMEISVGPVRFVLIYFMCGIVANLFSLVLNVYANSAGASGALFGLYGYSVTAFFLSNLNDPAARRRVLTSFVVFVLVNGMITLTINVDMWGHIGGFIAGAVLALIQLRLRLLISNIQLALATVAVTLLMFLLPRDQLRYYRLFQGVLEQERATNDYHRHELGDAELLDSLTYAVRQWDSLESAFQNIGSLRTALHHDTAIMRQYVRLHRRVTNYRVLMLSKQSYVYLDSIEVTNAAYKDIQPLHYNLDYYPRAAFSTDTPTDTTQKKSLAPRRVFYDAEWREIEDPSAARFYRLGQVDSAGRWQGIVRDYYRSGAIQMKGTYTDNLKDGVFLYYSDHNTYTSAGRYQREESVGKWESFHWNGELNMEVYHNDKAFVSTVLDSLGRVQVQGGNGAVTSWHSNGAVSETGQYIDGARTGDWLGYYDDGKPYYREQYRDNRLVQGASVDRQGKRYVYDELSQYAYPKNGMDNFNRYVHENIRRPYPRAEGARVRVLFQVGKNGDLWDFVILEGFSPECDAEAIRLISEGPGWRQGLVHGQEQTPSQGYAVITF